MALDLEPKTLLGEMNHYFLLGHNLDIQVYNIALLSHKN